MPLNAADFSATGITHASDSITIWDDFGDYYTTSWEFKEADPVNNPVMVGLSIPVYWKDFNNIGIETGILAKIYSLHGGAGVYFEGSIGRIGINASTGISSPLTGNFYKTTIVPATYAYPGDPGMYLNGNFRNPSSFRANVNVETNDSLGIFSSVSLKWHFIKWLYLEGGYSYYGKSGTKITGITVDTSYTSEDKYDTDGSISLAGRHVIYLGAGIGF